MSEATKKGKLIVFEGVSGAGILTHLKRLGADLKDDGHRVTTTMSPDFGHLSRTDLEMFRWHFGQDFFADFLREVAARRQLCSATIRPALKSGDIVLCKYFTASSMANARARGMERILDVLGMTEAHARGFQIDAEGELIPDLVVFFDIPLPVVMRRRHLRGDQDQKEEIDYLTEQIKALEFEAALLRQSKRRVAVIDTNRDKEDVYEEVMAVVKAELAR